MAHRLTKGPSLEGAVASDFSALARSQAGWRAEAAAYSPPHFPTPRPQPYAQPRADLFELRI